MGSRLVPITTFLLVALASAILVDSYSKFHEDTTLDTTLNLGTSDGEVGTCGIDGSEARQKLNASSSRRVLAGATTYISYDALKKNKVPCDQRGSAYYNCAASGKANVYKRSCNAATRCARH